MEFTIEKSVELLSRTPAALTSLLQGIHSDWTSQHEGEGTWTVADTIGHLIICEETNFMRRAEIILSDSSEKILAPMNRLAQFDAFKGTAMPELLALFSEARKKNLAVLAGYHIKSSDLLLQANHPELGIVTLQQVLATWVAHDMTHIAQIVRIIARQYTQAVGPFSRYLRILGTAEAQ
jgi:hypothetical protein